MTIYKPRCSFILPVVIIIILAVMFIQSSNQSAFSQQDDGSETTMSIPPTSTSASEESITSYIDALIKAPLLVSQCAIIGVVFSQILFKRVFSNRKLILMNSSRQNTIIQTDRGVIKRLFLILIISAGTLIASGTGSLVLQVYNLSSELGLGFSDTFSILINTSIGTTWILRIVTSVLILVLAIMYYYVLARKKKEEKKKKSRLNTNISGTNKISSIILYTILALGSINIISNSTVSHNAAAEFLPWLAITVDWFHMMAVSVWLGGLFYISLILLYAIRISSISNLDYGMHTNAKENLVVIRKNSFSLAIMLPYFSMIAVISLGVIGISGLYMAWLQLHSIDSLFDSTYGNILIIKLCTIAPMVALGAYHQIRLHYSMIQIAQQKENRPQEQFENTSNKFQRKDSKDTYNVQRSRYDPFRRFSKTIKVESLVGITVLVITSFLTITSPPSMVHSDSQMQMGMGMEMQGSGGITDGDGSSSDSNQVSPKITETFTVTALILATSVLVASIYYYRKSKQSLKTTVDRLQNKEK